MPCQKEKGKDSKDTSQTGEEEEAVGEEDPMEEEVLPSAQKWKRGKIPVNLWEDCVKLLSECWVDHTVTDERGDFGSSYKQKLGQAHLHAAVSFNVPAEDVQVGSIVF